MHTRLKGKGERRGRTRFHSLAAVSMVIVSVVACSVSGEQATSTLIPPTLTKTPIPTSTPTPTPTPIPAPQGVWSSYWTVNEIYDIEQDGEGYLWARGSASVVRWNTVEGTYQEFGTNQGLPSNVAQHLFIGPQGHAWLSFSQHGLWRFDDPEWTPFIEQGSVEGTRLDAYAISPNGELWICTDEGLSKFNGEEWIAYQIVGGATEGFCEYLTVDKEGNPWMQGTYGISVLHEPDDWVVYDSAVSERRIDFSHPNGAYTAPDGTVWFSYLDHILWFNGEVWQVANIGHNYFGLSSTGQPWVVSGGDIITYVYGSHWRFDISGDEDPVYVTEYYWPLPFHDNMPTQTLYEIYAGLNGEMWITSFDGLVRIRGNSITLIPIEGVSSPLQFLDIEITRQGEIYLALPEGISRLSGSQLIPLRADAGLNSNRTSMLAVGQDGTLWVRAWMTLQSYDGASWITHSPPSSSIVDIKVAPNGDVWVAHRYDGVSRWDGNTWEQFLPGSASGYFSGSLKELFISPDGVICLAIEEVGVSCFDGSRWTGIAFNEGMITQWITDIVMDAAGDIYLTAEDVTSAYLHRYDGESWTSREIQDKDSVLAVAPDGSVWIGEREGSVFNIRDGEWSNNDLASGLPIDRIYDFEFGRDGSMWLGTDNGAWRFDGQEWQSFMPEDALRSDYVRVIAVGTDNTIWFGGIGLARYGSP